MKKFFLSVGIILFVGSGYYLKENYTFVQLDSAQLAQVGSSTIQSSTLTMTDENGQAFETRVFLRVGSFALTRRPGADPETVKCLDFLGNSGHSLPIFGEQ